MKEDTDQSNGGSDDGGDDDHADGPASLASLPIELVAMIVNGRDRRGRAFMDPRWRPMARMACRLLRRAVENPTPWDSHALGDPQGLFRRPMVDAGDVYVDIDTTHARRRRWRCGMLVCASAVVEWLVGAPMDLAVPHADAVVERMVADWGASRAQAHVALLATGRPDAVAYALDPTTSAPFAPLPAVPTRPSLILRPDRPGWSPGGSELAYVMLDVAVRRCTVSVCEAVVAAIDALYPDDTGDGATEDDEDIDSYRMPERRGLWRADLQRSVIGFDRADVSQALGEDFVRSVGIAQAIACGAADCLLRHYYSHARGAGSLADAVASWARGACLGWDWDMGTRLPVSRALDVIPAGAITPEHHRAVALAAIRNGDVDLIAWALAALGHAQISARALVDATGLTHTGLVCHALHPITTTSERGSVRRGVGHLAGATRSVDWLCDVLGYTPAHDDMAALAQACIERGNSGHPACCVARVAFVLARWPLLLWESGHGVPLVRDAFVSCMIGYYPTPDVIILIDAVEAWCDTIGVDRREMREHVALLCSVAANNCDHECVRQILMALNGSPCTKTCSSVCYGTCRGSPPDPSQPFCNGRSRSDWDAVVAWCVPTFAADRWHV
ncbi:hypothetical protein [Pandoravirus japonicus]|uniref:F-box incomplete domain containing protein n=1 Tax=Pandoravirus japonicus TaxID=2823154 RepID=A0A811BQR6_9VIRU|nr:hypothetical protein [Pandoravirus japonicus]